MPREKIEIDKPVFDELEKAYHKAVKDKKETFIFDGGEFLTDYAKYLIEYLKPKFYAEGKDES